MSPDIAMCKNKNCSKKDTCYRYKAKPNPYRQSYMSFGEDGESCYAYIECKSKGQKKRLDIQCEGEI